MTLPAPKQVEIKADFFMGVFEVTQEQWSQVMGRNPSYFSRIGKSKERVQGISDEDLKLFPVENISWFDAQEFVQKLNALEKQNGWVSRLPTEAEWAYACRGAPTTKEAAAFNFYADQPTNFLLSTQANFNGTFAKGPYLGHPCKVGSYKPNKLGLYDTHGNVQEGTESVATLAVPMRVNRGGSWGDSAVGCLATAPPTCRNAFTSTSVVVSRRCRSVPVSNKPVDI